jgi:hypothetical protein
MYEMQNTQETTRKKSNKAKADTRLLKNRRGRGPVSETGVRNRKTGVRTKDRGPSQRHRSGTKRQEQSDSEQVGSEVRKMT